MDVIGRDRVCKILMSSSAPSLDGQWAAHSNAQHIPVQRVLFALCSNITLWQNCKVDISATFALPQGHDMPLQKNKTLPETLYDCS